MHILLSDQYIRWIQYTKDEKICKRYPLDLWHQAVHDVDSDEEWGAVLSEASIVNCYVLKLCSNEKSIAFVYTIQEVFDGMGVSIHGGGWEYPIMYYRGYILMIRHLLAKGLKVRTYCQLSNPAAIRFSRSVGFVQNRYTKDEVYMWISTQRLTASKLYKRFYNNKNY